MGVWSEVRERAEKEGWGDRWDYIVFKEGRGVGMQGTCVGTESFLDPRPLQPDSSRPPDPIVLIHQRLFVLAPFQVATLSLRLEFL